MSNDKVLVKVIDEAGYSGESILKQANQSDVKADLRARTAEAKQEGICGVPSYRVFKRPVGGEWKMVGDIVWGQDLITDVEDYIAGSNGTTAMSGEEQRQSRL